MKANYSLTMFHEESHHGLWNMPVTNRDCNCDDCEAKMCRTDFMTSPIMGTYQPTFIIHDMDFIESKFWFHEVMSKVDGHFGEQSCVL